MPENLHHHSDEQLVEFVARRDESVQAMNVAHAAMEILYDRYARPLRPFLATRVNPRDEAEDVQQMVWTKVWRGPHGSLAEGHFRAWLYRIARNAAIDHHRKMRPELVDDLDTRSDPRGQSPETGLIEQARKEALSRCLERLEAALVALVRARLEGRSYDEISKELSLALQRAYKMYHSAKKQLQTCVERELS
jgi:RNA polymerase sigma-70 factor (ECF subfamily)